MTDYYTAPLTPDESVTPAEAPDVQMHMQPEAFQELRDAVAGITLRDHELGRVLTLFALHVGHAHGLDPTIEDEKAAKARAVKEAAETAQQEQDEQPVQPLQFPVTDASPETVHYPTTTEEEEAHNAN